MKKEKILQCVQLIEQLGDMIKESSPGSNDVYELRSIIETMATVAGIVEDILVEDDDND